MILGIVFIAGLYRYISHPKENASRPEWKILELLLPSLLLIESLIQFFGKPLFHLIYIPYIVLISGFVSHRIVLSCIAAIFFLGAPMMWWIRGIFTEEGAIYLSILATGIVSYGIFYQKKKTSERALDDLEKLKDSALNLELSAEKSFTDENRFSHLLKSVFETENDIKEMLKLMAKVIHADSVAYFDSQHDSFVKKASSDSENSRMEHPSEKYLQAVIKNEKPVAQSRFEADSYLPIQFTAKKPAASLCVPVLDGKVPLGVISAVSTRLSAFGEHEKDIALSFAFQIVEILRRSRHFFEMERIAKGFRLLAEASEKFSSSLKVDQIADEFVKIVSRMVNSSAVGFFLPDKGKLKVIARKGFEPAEESFYPKDVYYFNLIVKNKQLIHISRLDKKQVICPFNMPDAKTFLGIPVISENSIQGIIAFVSKDSDAISSFYVGLLKMMVNQAALSMANAQLHREVNNLAITDGLTGLYNHKQFQERLSQEFQRIERIPHSISLMLIDIDHFKKINDTYGHPAGDEVLIRLSDSLKKTLRGIDIIARYGGEEFAAVLINTDIQGAKKIAERLRRNVMNTSFEAEGKTVSLTLSIGVCAFPHDAETKEELISKADQALYYAKNHGRNQVCAWKDGVKKV